MTRRAVVALLHPIGWHPPGVDPERWRHALAEDAVDLLNGLNEVTPAVAHAPGDGALAAAVTWPGTLRYPVPGATVTGALRAAAADGFDQAAVLAADAPDLPGLLVGKLLRPLTTRAVAVAPALDGAGLLGVACRLPVPAWLPEIDLDTAGAARIRHAAPAPTDVVSTPGWRRLRGAAALAGLDPAVEGWDATRLLLGG
ncbi:hypothetical protein [Rhizomonospora bruguierae]|uniref:hypothetical protein n=1 Tax=Rhizomonospora bruguierae TaxID=1581705 RepID=UPI001BCBE408|nr:hypothetical protein [Micromonospora sp. NBRC 107566]